MAFFAKFRIEKADVYDSSVDIEQIEIEDDIILDYVKEQYTVEETFGENILDVWAKENGYIKENE